jgi:prephenate dehydratase
MQTTQLATPTRQRQRVVIQGVRGAFHEMAARAFYGADIDLVPALSFDLLVRRTADPAQADTAVMAIENSIAGSILGNYSLLQHHDLCITGEVFLRIEQNLMALPGTTPADIREVHSHPMALAQCTDYLATHPDWRLVESADTAESAARIAREGLTQVAAIGSSLAAELYGLKILAPSIETNRVNFTRFLALERRVDARSVPGANKASVSFTVPHRSGSLSAILAMLAADSANLTKIQSVPIPGTAWEYHFFIDFTVPNPATMTATLRLLDAMTTGLKVLGIYKSAEPAKH